MLILASSSQTRANILKNFNIKFIQREVNFDESSVKDENPVSFIYKIAQGKKVCYEQQHKDNLPFLVADTVVVAKGEILQKAKDEFDARKMLEMQSGNEVKIITCMICKNSFFEFTDISQTKYIFSKFDNIELEKYLKSSEWIGKAGACMVEGFCKPYIKSVVGFESTAMGLSIEKLIPFLEIFTCKESVINA